MFLKRKETYHLYILQTEKHINIIFYTQKQKLWVVHVWQLFRVSVYAGMHQKYESVL